ncbi:hypothetical protein HY346_01175 [Candidatus Microgenomates bacterium]|nr:hypothetical protein [Candidatus Microgenomates bacterium]
MKVLWFGAGLVGTGVLLAIVFQYSHFYEFLLIGLALLLTRVPNELQSWRSYSLLYLGFLAAGVVLDLALGLLISGLWQYNYQSDLEYIWLYGLVYPLGGYVMLQSFLLGKLLLKLQPSKPNRSLPWLAPVTALVALVTLAIGIFMIGTAATTAWRIGFVIMAALAGILITNWMAQTIGRRSFVAELLDHPLALLLTVAGAAYANFLVHELPNLVAHQWVYGVPDGLPSTPILGIPLLLFSLWPLLVLAPVSSYYLVLAIEHWLRRRANHIH